MKVRIEAETDQDVYTTNWGMGAAQTQSREVLSTAMGRYCLTVLQVRYTCNELEPWKVVDLRPKRAGRPSDMGRVQLGPLYIGRRPINLAKLRDLQQLLLRSTRSPWLLRSSCSRYPSRKTLNCPTEHSQSLTTSETVHLLYM